MVFPTTRYSLDNSFIFTIIRIARVSPPPFRFNAPPPLCLSVSVANPMFSVFCGLFVISKKVNSFAIKQIQPLFAKHPGWGVPLRASPVESATSRLFFRTLFAVRLSCSSNDRAPAARHSPLSAATMDSMRLKTLCIALLFLLPSAASAQTAPQILAKVFAARGGLAKIRSINSERVSGQISFGEVTGPFVVELKRPLKMHMQLTIQNQTMVRVYDGKSQGWANNPFAGKMNPDTMNEDELKSITEESDFDGPLVDYKSKGNQIELVGKDKVGDKDAWRLKLTTKNGDVRAYLFDASSFLLLKWEGKRKYEGQEIPVESYFSDYREVGGLKFAFGIDSGSSAAQITQKIRIEKIDLNPALDDAEFTKPPTPPQPEAAPATPAQPPA
jgi:outer membrane lipoprotein-sorting protein